uniref:chitinase n=1 Tax=Denticeps clupeoides TaxID=299321 RepID=A0AAY4C815_9TELE
MARLLFVAVASTKLVCYITNWAQYRPGAGKFTPDNVDPFLCTHVIFTLATITKDNQLTTVEWNDVEMYQSLNRLKNVFIEMVSKPENREKFIASALSFLRTHEFDGMDLAWEFPGHNGSPPQDKQRFTALINELKEAMAKEAVDTKKTPLLLSAKVAPLKSTVDIAYNVSAIARWLDFLSIMTYDYHGHWESVTGHNSPLYPSSIDKGTHLLHNIDASVTYWLEQGAPADKLLMTFPTFGRTFHLTTSAQGLGVPTNGPAEAGPYTRDAGFWSYYEVSCYILSSTFIGWIEEQKVPYAARGQSWVGFDNQESFTAKWLTVKDLGGVSVWTLDFDDFGGTFCSEGDYPLVNHLPPTTTPDPITSFCVGRPDGLYPNPTDETTYFQCFRGNTYLHKCQPGLIYQDSCKCCNWP